jgi:hypothetical protein
MLQQTFIDRKMGVTIMIMMIMMVMMMMMMAVGCNGWCPIWA